MRRTRWTAVLACFVTIAVISFILFDLMLRHRGWVPGLTAWGAVVAIIKFSESHQFIAIIWLA